jgi:hypothetical protein
MAVELGIKGENQFTVNYANSAPPTVPDQRFNQSDFDNFHLALAEVLQSQVYFLFFSLLFFLFKQIVPFLELCTKVLVVGTSKF